MKHLQQILREKLLPQNTAGAAERIVVARKKMSQAEIPDGVMLEYRKIEGKRVVVKGGRLYGNTRLVSARWPESGMHELEIHRFICVVSGKVNFQAGDYLLGCGEGDYILVPPHLPHMGDENFPNLLHSRIPGQSCLLLWMTLYRRGFQCWLTRYGDEQRFGGPTENYLFLNGQVIELFHLLLEEACGAKNIQLCNGLLLTFLIALQREVEAGHYLHPGPVMKTASSAADNNFSTQLEDYIRGHLNQPMTLEQVARELYMSRAQLARVVRRETGHSFGELLTAYRIDEAKKLLRESEWTAQTIAQFVGFKSAAYFHVLFQRQVGCTPGVFRLHARKNGSLSKTDPKKKAVRR